MEFKLTPKETENAKEFQQQHYHCSSTSLGKPFFSTTGGQFTFFITPTGLGNCVSIRCNACDMVAEITDASNW